MRVSYPWRFNSENYHIRIRTNEKYDIANILGIKVCDEIDCKTDEVLLTFSDVVSTINENDKIMYHENIIKCKVIHEGKAYYYPIITFVDDEYSLIRGYYLGFEKKFAKIKVTENKIGVDSELIRYELDINKSEPGINKKEITIREKEFGDVQDKLDGMVKFVTYPFLLIRDWKFDEEYVKHEFVTLRTNGYNVKKSVTFDIKEVGLDNVLKTLRINKENVSSIEKYYIEDEFILEGVVSCLVVN